MKLLYIDNFTHNNSNHFWLEAFRNELGEKNVDVLEIFSKKIKKIDEYNKIFADEYDHIHLGGSVKYDILPERISAYRTRFYGDALFPPFVNCDKIFISNMTYVRKLQNIKTAYMPSPTNLEVFKKIDIPKKFDVVYISNNYHRSRKFFIRKVLKAGIKLECFGHKFKNGPVFYDEFTKIVNQAKICLNIVDDKYRHLKNYFSNRLMNYAACQAYILTPVMPFDMPCIFKNVAVYYTDIDDALEKIQMFLIRDEEMQKAAIRNYGECAHSVAQEYTYNKAIKRILYEK